MVFQARKQRFCTFGMDVAQEVGDLVWLHLIHDPYDSLVG